MGIVHMLLLGAVAFLASFALVPLVRKIAIEKGVIDYPGGRRAHTEPTPRLGGLAMFGGILVAFLFEVVLDLVLDLPGFFQRGNLGVNALVCLLGLAIIVVVGAVDDFKSIKPWQKFLGQIAGAAVIMLSGVLLEAIKNPVGNGFIHFGVWAYPITILYFLVFMNAINLIDGLDGLASGIVCIAALTLFFIAFGRERYEVASISLVLTGVTLAFLRYNHHPATIFMGDSGSLLLGAMLGIVSLVGVMRSPTFIVLSAPFVVAAIPLLDTTMAILRRLYHHQPIQQADKSHLHHVLLRSGLSVRQVVYVVWLWTAALGVSAYIISCQHHGIYILLIFIVLLIVTGLMFYKFGVFDLTLRHHYSPRSSVPEDDEGEEADE